MCDQVPGYHDLAKLTCNNNHHSQYTGPSALMHSAQQPQQKALRALCKDHLGLTTDPTEVATGAIMP